MEEENSASRREPGPGPLADFRFGAIAVWGGLVSPEALEGSLAEQSAMRSRPSGDAQAGGKDAPRIGEMLVQRELITEDEARRILRVQLQRLHAREHRTFGSIAVARRFATDEAVSRALDMQSREILAGGEERHLSDILADAGAILPGEVEAILAYQARGDSVPMSEVRKKTGPGKRARGDAAARARADEEHDEPSARRPPDHAEGAASPASVPAPAPKGRARPGFLPRGVRGFLYDNSVWIVAGLASAVAAVLVIFREAIFG